MSINKKHLIIVGSGFAGVELARKMKPLVKKGLYDVTLISNHGYFEYYPGVYRIMIGETPIQTKVHLSYIIPDCINVIEDTIIKVETQTKNIFGKDGEVYKYDELVLALDRKSVV